MSVFLSWRLTCCPSIPSLSLPPPLLGLISLACPDGLESVPGKAGHPSPPPSSHPTSISPFPHLPWGEPPPPSGTMSKNRNHRDDPQHSALTKHYVKQYPHCVAKVLCGTTFFQLIYSDIVPKWTHVCIWQSKLLFVPLLLALGDNRPTLKVKLQMC